MTDIINLYEILNVDKSCCNNDIKKAFRKLVKNHHPDKGGDPIYFKLITNAYEILGDSNSKIEYDNLLEQNEKNKMNHFNLKKNSLEYINLQQNNDPDNILNAKNNFNTIFDDLNKKHNYNEEDIKDDIDINKKLKDLEKIRKHDDITILSSKLFTNDNFNVDYFNEIFEKTNQETTNNIIEFKEPVPLEISSYCSLSDYGKLYAIDECDINDVNYNKYGFIADVYNNPIIPKNIKLDHNILLP